MTASRIDHAGNVGRLSAHYQHPLMRKIFSSKDPYKKQKNVLVRDRQEEAKDLKHSLQEIIDIAQVQSGQDSFWDGDESHSSLIVSG